MIRRTIFLLTILVLVHAAAPAAAQVDESVKKAVEQAALDYLDGAHAGDAARVGRAVHPEFTKASVRKLQTGRQALRKAGYTRLVELVRGNMVALPEEEREIEVTVFAVREGLACVKAESAMFCEYLLLADMDGEWKIINTLWRMNPEWVKKNRPETAGDAEAFDATAEKRAIETAAMDYLEGYFTGDAERMARGVHPELTKVWPMTFPKTGGIMLEKIGASYLVEATRTGSGKLDADKRNIEMTVFDYNDEIAAVEVLSAMFYDYLQLAKINGEWKIVNVLWTMNPDAPKR